MKLVRDKVPKLYPGDGYRLARSWERDVFLRMKVAEEAGEVLSAVGEANLLEEVADLMEAVEALAAGHGWSIEGAVRAARDAKRLERGAFAEGWVLE